MVLDVSAVVVTYNSENHISALLDSLPDAFGDRTASVVVVDNGSTDGTVRLLQERSDCTVIRSTNHGYAAGVNRGVRSSPEAASILVLNPDATLDPGSVVTMLSVLQGRGVGIVAPRTRESDGRLSPTIRRAPTLPRVGGLSFTGLPFFAERVDDPRAYTHQHEVDWAVGAVLLVDAACFQALNGFDESFFLYSEETDFCLRAKERGWSTIYTPDAGAMHEGGGSGETATTHTMKILNRVRLYRRRTGPARAFLYYVLTIGVELRRGILGHRHSWTTVRALLRPNLRPSVLNLGDVLVPA